MHFNVSSRRPIKLAKRLSLLTVIFFFFLFERFLRALPTFLFTSQSKNEEKRGESEECFDVSKSFENVNNFKFIDLSPNRGNSVHSRMFVSAWDAFNTVLRFVMHAWAVLGGRSEGARTDDKFLNISGNTMRLGTSLGAESLSEILSSMTVSTPRLSWNTQRFLYSGAQSNDSFSVFQF